MKIDSDWKSRALTPEEVVKLIPLGAHVFLHGACATPLPLVRAMCDRADLSGVRLYHLHTEGGTPFASPEVTDRIRPVAFFLGAGVREAVAEGRADFIPVFLSDIPGLFTQGIIKLDVAVIQVSPPDRHGLCTLGTSVDAALAAVETARIVIAEINEQLPRTHGRTVVPLRRISAFTHTDRPLAPRHKAEVTAVEDAIGAHIAQLVEDGACLQLGIGGIPDAVLSRLGGKNDLGVHTEMFSDGIVDLARNGNITNRRKAVHAGRSVTSFVAGGQKLFDFVHDNPLVEFHPCNRTNAPNIIAQNPGVVAINSALAVDLTGQVCADSIGHRIYSGIGGQMDFIRAAHVSKGGKPIIALPSTASGGRISRITAELAPGSGVVTTRGHCHWVVTEYGAANLHGLSLRDRAAALISIAHPDFRAELRTTINGIRHF